MTVLKRRDRVLIFRLTQDEYDNLLAACAVRGARNLSDFARSELLGLIEAGRQEQVLEGRLSTVEQQLSDLQSAMQRVTHLLERINAAGNRRRARA